MRIPALMLAAFLLAPVHTTVTEAAVIPVEAMGAKYGPGWRGPSGQAIAGGYVDRGSDTENVKWKVAALAVAFLAGVAALMKPNFAGTWQVDPPASQGRGSGGGPDNKPIRMTQVFKRVAK